jgi:hypothetical protein
MKAVRLCVCRELRREKWALILSRCCVQWRCGLLWTRIHVGLRYTYTPTPVPEVAMFAERVSCMCV